MKLDTKVEYKDLKLSAQNLVKELTAWDESMIQRKSTAYDDVENFPNPSYDNQADVYAAAIVLLDEAIANGVGGSTKFRAAYAGSFDWEEVANTLKARAYLHLGNYSAAKTAAMAGISEGNDMYALHDAGYTPGKHNLFYDFLDWNRGGYMSCSGSHVLTTTSSPVVIRPWIPTGTMLRTAITTASSRRTTTTCWCLT